MNPRSRRSICFSLVVVFGLAAIFVSCSSSGSRQSRAVEIRYDRPPPRGAFQFTVTMRESVEEIVDRVQDELAVPGISVGVVSGDRLVYVKGFGVQGTGGKTAASSGTLYHIGSVSKPVTTTLLAIYLERGIVSLQDPISKYLPDEVTVPVFREDPTEIRIWHLATHTSGLPRSPPNRRNVPYGLGLNPGQPQPYSHEQLYEGLASTKLLSKPGTECRYSNYGLGLLGHVLEQAGGKPLETLLKEDLFSPLGMKSSTVQLAKAQQEHFAAHHWHDDRNRPRRERPPTEFGDIFAHG
ncbi:MAG: serine hydrolase domain-containing protein, partial [Verrucomicrobiota bacterium]